MNKKDYWQYIFTVTLIVGGILWILLDNMSLRVALPVMSLLVIVETFLYTTRIKFMQKEDVWFSSFVLIWIWICCLGSWWLVSDFEKNIESEKNGYLGYLSKKWIKKGRSSKYYIEYECSDADTCFIVKNDAKLSDYYSEDGSMDIVIISKDGYLLKKELTSIEKSKYLYSVKYLKDYYEIGNDSYEYARFEPNREYDNFGLNVVYLSSKDDDNINISWKTVTGKSQKMQAPAGIRDTFLVYSNINPKFFDGWHVCPDSISTPENFAKIEEGGYGYIFRGKIYSKEETEKYWNIIEQYKLRETGK